MLTNRFPKWLHKFAPSLLLPALGIFSIFLLAIFLAYSVRLYYVLFFFSWPYCMACGILAPEAEIEPAPFAFEA